MDYFASSEAERRQICEALVKYGCCSRCVLRFLGLKDCYTFRKTQSEIDAIVNKLIKTPEAGDVIVNSAGDCDGKNDGDKTDIEMTNWTEEQTVTSKGEDVSMETASSDPMSSNAPGLGQKTVNGQSNSSSEVPEEHVPCEVKDEQTEESLCVLCLGILQEFSAEKFLEEIRRQVQEEDYHFETYLCSLMIPTCIILREHSMFLYVQEKFGGVYNKVKESDIVPIKEIWKWRNGPVLRRILNTPFNLQSPMEITLTFVYPESDKECNFLYSLQDNNVRKRKQDKRKKQKKELLSRATVAKAVYGMKNDEFLKYYNSPPGEPAARCSCVISFMHEQVFVAGRYNKYSRTLSQTPWILEGVRKSELSVEEIICDPIDKEFKPSTHKFSSSGREDVDVKMLGTGRPFLVELVNPRHADLTQEQVTQIQKTINASSTDVQVRDLQIVSREETNNLKEGEIDKLKTYSALCWSARPLSLEQLDSLAQHKDLMIYQKTPIRVLHRRPLSTREKCIHGLTAKKVDAYHFQLELSTQAGTYIKEFVHGDLGRTKPNLCSMLGVDCDILELDVKSIDLDWPKRLDIQDQPSPPS